MTYWAAFEAKSYIETWHLHFMVNIFYFALWQGQVETILPDTMYFLLLRLSVSAIPLSHAAVTGVQAQTIL